MGEIALVNEIFLLILSGSLTVFVQSSDLEVLFQFGKGTAQKCILCNLYRCVVVRSHSPETCHNALFSVLS